MHPFTAAIPHYNVLVSRFLSQAQGDAPNPAEEHEWSLRNKNAKTP